MRTTSIPSSSTVRFLIARNRVCMSTRRRRRRPLLLDASLMPYLIPLSTCQPAFARLLRRGAAPTTVPRIGGVRTGAHAVPRQPADDAFTFCVSTLEPPTRQPCASPSLPLSQAAPTDFSGYTMAQLRARGARVASSSTFQKLLGRADKARLLCSYDDGALCLPSLPNVEPASLSPGFPRQPLRRARRQHRPPRAGARTGLLAPRLLSPCGAALWGPSSEALLRAAAPQLCSLLAAAASTLPVGCTL